jgi:hypothetical protein
LGNTSIYLGNTTTSIGNLTLTNATISSGTVNITNVTVTTANVTNITVTGTANIATGNITTLTSTSITDSGLTSGRVTYAGASGLLKDSANLTFDGSNLGVANGNNEIFQVFPAFSSNLNLVQNYNYTSSVYIANENRASFYTWKIGTTEAMRIDSSGSLLVGTSGAPTAGGLARSVVSFKQLNDSGTSANIIYSSGIQLEANGNTNVLSIGYDGSSFGFNASYRTTGGYVPMVFCTGGPERMRIDTSGNLLVGTTSTAGTVVGARMLPSGLIQGTKAGSTDADTQYDVYSTGASAYRFYVGMGGTIFATSIVISAISDQRLKENIRDLDTGLSTIMALKPRRFDWKEGKGQDKKNVAGFIAQEYQEVLPNSISTFKQGDDGIDYLTMNHEELIPTLVKAIQDQQSLIESLTTRLIALENK